MPPLDATTVFANQQRVQYNPIVPDGTNLRYVVDFRKQDEILIRPSTELLKEWFSVENVSAKYDGTPLRKGVVRSRWGRQLFIMWERKEKHSTLLTIKRMSDGQHIVLVFNSSTKSNIDYSSYRPIKILVKIAVAYFGRNSKPKLSTTTKFLNGLFSCFDQSVIGEWFENPDAPTLGSLEFIANWKTIGIEDSQTAVDMTHNSWDPVLFMLHFDKLDIPFRMGVAYMQYVKLSNVQDHHPYRRLSRMLRTKFSDDDVIRWLQDGFGYWMANKPKKLYQMEKSGWTADALIWCGAQVKNPAAYQGGMINYMADWDKVYHTTKGLRGLITLETMVKSGLSPKEFSRLWDKMIAEKLPGETVDGLAKGLHEKLNIMGLMQKSLSNTERFVAIKNISWCYVEKN